MRTLDLLAVAAQAEGLRLRRTATLVAKRTAWMAAAGVFALAAIALGHAAAISGLVPHYGLTVAFGIVALADLVLAGGFALLARSRRDPVVEEALALRRATLAAARRPPVRNAIAVAMAAAPWPMFGAIAGEAVATWLRRR